MLLKSKREEVIEYARRMSASKLVSGTWGNLSVRDPETGLIAITPSGMDYDSLEPQDIVVMDETGKIVDGKRRPTIEVPLHLGLFRNRKDINGIVHTHSIFATTLGVLNLGVPVVSAEMAAVVGGPVPVAPFAVFGTEEFGRIALETMGDGCAVVLKNHGVVAVGPALPDAFAVASVVEDAAMVYVFASMIGKPDLVPEEYLGSMRSTYLNRYGQRVAS
ncbi:MAG TPA: hypothetical protein GX506_00605 [Firmicutes bacterium]|nr:hypothetical protein [Bacillota bacterium]